MMQDDFPMAATSPLNTYLPIPCTPKIHSSIHKKRSHCTADKTISVIIKLIKRYYAYDELNYSLISIYNEPISY